jgi:hypothetical protein
MELLRRLRKRRGWIVTGLGILLPPSALLVASMIIHPPPQGSRDEARAAVAYDEQDYRIPGRTLVMRQVERGLTKRIDRRRRRDQSLAGLRDVIRDAESRRMRRLLPEVDRLEEIVRNGEPVEGEVYTEHLVEYLTPICVYIQEQTGLPASVIMGQVIVESGWGGSNITFTKSNLLGIGNCTEPDEWQVEVKLGDRNVTIPVRCVGNSSAFDFESLRDSLFYYVFVLLQSPDNTLHYDALREYVEENRDLRLRDPAKYRREVIERLAEGYHGDPDWYVKYLGHVAGKHALLDGMSVENRRTMARADGVYAPAAVGGARVTP